MKFFKHQRIVYKAVASVLLVILFKLMAHWIGWEIISLNPLFSGLIAANIFLMGFLLSGVLTDYKESEKLPGELAVSLETIANEFAALSNTNPDPVRRDGIGYLLLLSLSIHEWLNKKCALKKPFDAITALNPFFARLEPLIPANYVVRLKQEQSNLWRLLTRVHTIRETSFIPSGYTISEVVTVLLTVGLILSRIDPFYESLFFVGIITFLFSFLGLLIRDLDDPFGYSDGGSAEDVSLQPLLDTIARIRAIDGKSNS